MINTEETEARVESERLYLTDFNRPYFIGFSRTGFERGALPELEASSRLQFTSLHGSYLPIVTQGNSEHPVVRNSFSDNLLGLPLHRGENGWSELGLSYHRSWLHIESSLVGGVAEDSWWQLKKAFVELRLNSLIFSVGRKPLWWGRSTESSLLISHNAQSFDLISLSSLPVKLPGWFSKLGYFKSEIFASRLDDERVPENDWLVGWRFGWSPASVFEINTALLYQFEGKGVKGGSTKNTLLEFLGARGKASPGEDQGGGLSDITNRAVEFDLSFRLFESSFPSSIYTEQHFEDCCGDTRDFFKHSYSYIYGLSFAPKLALKPLVNLEYIKTASALYSHPRWVSGSSNHSRLFGHPIGADAQRIQLRGYLRPPFRDMKLTSELWWEERRRTGNSTSFNTIQNIFPDFQESEKRLGALLVGDLSVYRMLRANLGGGLLRVSNRGYRSSDDAYEWATSFGLSYNFENSKPLF